MLLARSKQHSGIMPKSFTTLVNDCYMTSYSVCQCRSNDTFCFSSGHDQSVNVGLESNADSSEKAPSDNSNYNMQLLAHSAQQHLLQQQNGSQQVLPGTGIHPNMIATGSGMFL